MSAPKKRPLNATPTAWNNPFDNLAGDTLPAGPSDSAPELAAPNPATVNRGRVVLRREKAHRGGKTVIVVDGFDPQIKADTIEDIGRQLRKACGCGGTTKDRAIELQGDQPAKIRATLETMGFRVAGIT